MKLDQVDISILNALQDNARTGLEQLAHVSGVSIASVQRRLKALREGGFILREVALLDGAKLGQAMTFIIMVELERERLDQIDDFVKRARQEPQVQQCYYVTGEADFCLICIAKDMAEFEALTHRLFFQNANVRRFRTSVVMGRKKIGLNVPLDMDGSE
ncbi:Lrp/AsnC family transcriptional regulator [Roseibium alexandrii]|uniref:Transcriptional regulator n=1 Tax=Roseibium alexandrii (strain DSM 17067 / NCIMB 14079 / DFL-11) TaxID=244592 RepID=A0A5E8H7C4_ROSAD|nr:Lrp/AsnC family transcriptional regulator [Roseibium alexandrii]EEE48091.1 Transcriptional regulator [Roseibium alexandrii DFL-11]